MNVPFFVAVAGEARDLIDLIRRIAFSYNTEGKALLQNHGNLSQVECLVRTNSRLPKTPFRVRAEASWPPGYLPPWRTRPGISTPTSSHKLTILRAILARGLDHILFVERAKVNPLWTY